MRSLSRALLHAWQERAGPARYVSAQISLPKRLAGERRARYRHYSTGPQGDAWLQPEAEPAGHPGFACLSAHFVVCRRTRVIIAKMKTMAKNELFRELPSVDELIRTSALAALANSNGMAVVTDATRVVLARLREEISSGFLDSQSLRVALDTIPNAVEAQLRKSLTHSLRPVINATGVILHTNLGR